MLREWWSGSVRVMTPSEKANRSIDIHPLRTLDEFHAAAPSCAACAAPLTGCYCHACGERAPRPEDDSLWQFLREQFQEVTSADGKMWRTLRALFVPGKLTTEYFDGRRGLYVRPIRLFLVANLALFFTLSFTSGILLQAPLRLIEQRMYWPLLQPHVEAQMEAWNVGREVYAAQFNTHGATLTRSLVILLVPMLATLLAVVLAPARASGVRHLVFATHGLSFVLAGVVMLGGPLLFIALLWIRLTGSFPINSFDPYLSPIGLAAILIYFVVGIRRVYRLRWRWAVPAGLFVSTIGTAVLYLVYQAVLAAITIATLDPPAG